MGFSVVTLTVTSITVFDSCVNYCTLYYIMIIERGLFVIFDGYCIIGSKFKGWKRRF